jgi:hypothetical protein
MLTSLTPISRAVFTIAAQVSSGKGTPFLVRSARIFPLGIAGDQHEYRRRQPAVALMKST